MIKTLKHLLGLAQREDATTAELTPSLPTAEAELAAARAAQTAAEQAYRSALLTPDDTALSQIDTARGEAKRRIERAEALVAALRERLSEAQARDAEVARVMRYEEARQQADDARAALIEWYPKLASDLVALLVGVAKAEQLVRAANADLPRNSSPIPHVERGARSRDGTPEEVTDRVRVTRWVHAGQVLPGSVDQDAVVPTGGGRGRLKVAGLPLNEGHDMELRTFTEEAFFPADHGAAPDALAGRLVLPGFHWGDADFFTPVDRPWQGTIQPEDVLSQISRLRARAPSGAPVQAIQKRLIPEDNSAVKPLPKPDNYRIYKGRYSEDEDAEKRSLI